MLLSDINPYMRYAELQPSVLSSAPFSCAYDHRLFYILDGVAELALTSQRVPLCRGMLIYLRPGVPYYFDGKVKVIVLNFDLTRANSHISKPMPPARADGDFCPESILEADAPNELRDAIIIRDAFDIEDRMHECLLHYTYPTHVSDAATSAIIKELLAYGAKSSKNEPMRLPELAQRIMLFIRQNYDRDITNDTVAAALGYHSFYLNRMFKKSTGTTIRQAIIAERIRIAKRLLRDTELAISAVAIESGFSDRSQFCTAFRKHTGKTPNEYRTYKRNGTAR